MKKNKKNKKKKLHVLSYVLRSFLLSDFEPYLSADEHFDVNDPDGSVKGEHYSATKNRFDVENSSVDTGVPGSPLGYINLGNKYNQFKHLDNLRTILFQNNNEIME